MTPPSEKISKSLLDETDLLKITQENQDPTGQCDKVTPDDEREMQSDDPGTTLPDILKDAKSLYDDLIAGKLKVQDIETSPRMAQIENQIQRGKEDLKRSRTSKLWLQYMDMIAILQSFIRAERTGDWLMHLAVLRDMLPFLASSGHNHYTKSLHLYLQNMDCLEEKHPSVYEHFMK